MKNIFVYIDGVEYKLGRFIAKGGEGHVYEVAKGLGVKIYPPKNRDSRESKVRAMVDSRLSETSSLIAYPKNIVTDEKGNFVGFSMKLFYELEPLHNLYSPKSRKEKFSSVDYRFLVRVATNVARGIAAVHSAGVIIGDINHSGILVGQDATVALIDADSFQFQLNSEFYPCTVGVPEFTSPELHGQDLSKIARTQLHDLFGLTVCIFLILFMGRHPYAGIYPRSITGLSEAIKNNLFVYSSVMKGAFSLHPPKNAMILADIPSGVADGFEKAFGLIPTDRPSSVEWVALLEGFEHSLSKCIYSDSHFYPSHLKQCFWCELQKNTSIDMFPGGVAHGAKTLHTKKSSLKPKPQHQSKSKPSTNTAYTSNNQAHSVTATGSSFKPLLWAVLLIGIPLFIVIQYGSQKEKNSHQSIALSSANTVEIQKTKTVESGTKISSSSTKLDISSKQLSLPNKLIQGEWKFILSCPELTQKDMVSGSVNIIHQPNFSGIALGKYKLNFKNNNVNSISGELVEHQKIAVILKSAVSSVTRRLVGSINADRYTIETVAPNCSFRAFKIHK